MPWFFPSIGRKQLLILQLLLCAGCSGLASAAGRGRPGGCLTFLSNDKNASNGQGGTQIPAAVGKLRHAAAAAAAGRAG